MRYAALALILICSIGVQGQQAQEPLLATPPKPSAAVQLAYQKAAIVTDMVREAQEWLALTQAKQKDAIDTFTAAMNKECPGCQYSPATNSYIKPAPKPAEAGKE